MCLFWCSKPERIHICQLFNKETLAVTFYSFWMSGILLRITVVILSWQGMLTLIFTNAHFWTTTIIPKTSASYSETTWVVDCSLHSLGESSAMFRVNCPFNGAISVKGEIWVSEGWFQIIFFNAIFSKEDVQQYHLLFLLQNKQGTRCRSVMNAFIY